MGKNKKTANTLLLISVCLLLFIYIGIFTYLNLFKYTEHVDSDIAVDALLAREIWEEKTLTPDNWIASTERLVVGVPALAALFYGASKSIVFSMGIACAITGILLLAAIGFTLKRCRVSNLGTATALLALCALPINGLRNDGQMVPFVNLLWFLFADYYALHSICLFLCIAFYLYLRENICGSSIKDKIRLSFFWLVLTGLCGGLALGGMRCLQVVVLPLTIWEILLLFFESKHMGTKLPSRRFLSTGFIGSLLLVGALAKLYPTNVDYPMFVQNANGMVERLTKAVPTAILECMGIAGGCTLTSFSAIMQMGILAVIILTVYGLFFLLKHKTTDNANNVPMIHKHLLQALLASLFFTVFVEIITTAETAHNYFFMVWFVVIAVFALMITYFEKASPLFARLIVVCVLCFAVCNIFYTYKDCITSTDNLSEYEEVIEYMEAEGINHGYAEFWDASRISIMTDGAITMGHSYHMEDLRMYWWTTSTKWYVPSLPENMPTAYVVCIEDKDAFEAQFEDPAIVTLGFENSRFAVYTSEQNLVPMI